MDSWGEISKIRHPSRPVLIKIELILNNTLIARWFWRISQKVSNSFGIVSKSNRIDTLWLVDHCVCLLNRKQSFLSSLNPKNANQMRQLELRMVRFDQLRFVHARMCSLDRFSNNRHSPSRVSIIIELLTAESCLLREFTTIFENSCKFVPIWIENVSNCHVIATRQLSMHNIWHTFIYEQFETQKIHIRCVN
jgi:hypothetical protein